MYFGDTSPSSPISREAYASDASLYCLLPREVVCPISVEQAIICVNRALARKIPVTPRGAGTGLAGGALGNGLVVDFSRLTEIISISAEERSVVCRPGIIYRDLNLALKDYGLFFPPDPSSGDSCQIGGMLANNSSGPRSVKYGLTSDYVEELKMLDNRGAAIRIRKMAVGSEPFHQFLSRHPDYREIYALLCNNRELICRRWPRVRKNSAGYNLKQVADDLDRGIFNLPALYVGSEGTLGLFLEARLRLLPLPGKPLSYRLFFASLEEAGEAVAPLLETGPAALEIVDGSTLDLIGRQTFAIPAEAEAMLLLEYDDDQDRHREELKCLQGRLPLFRLPEMATDENQHRALWAARKAIVPILYRHHAVKRPLPFIEDASLPVDRLTEFIGWIRRRLERDRLTFGLFGHIGDGNVHLRPLMDISQEKDFRLFRELYSEVYDKIISLGGSSTAEHADGRLRAAVVKKLYGPELYDLFSRIKSILDPENLLNPGVILSEKPFTTDIDFKKLELICAACGKCNGYCPAQEIFRREDFSPRGWLRMLHSAAADRKELGSFYRYCLNCKNCTTVCPAGVDIAGEILACKAEHPHSVAGKVISLFNRKKSFAAAMKIGSWFNPLARTPVGPVAASLVAGWKFGFDRQVRLPLPAGKSLRERHPQACRRAGGVALFHGCADNYFVSSVGDVALDLFAFLGMPLALPDQDCCGLPMEVYGHKDSLITKARHNIDSLTQFDAVVFTCASCLHRIAEYAALFGENDIYRSKAIELKKKLHDISAYLLDRLPDRPVREIPAHRRVSYHHPCHLRAAGLEGKPLALIEKLGGYELLHPERADRCCGQAGSFGYIHYREGRAVFAEKKREYQKLNPDIIVSSCPSCLAKIRQEMGSGVRVCHPIELAAAAFGRV